MAVTAKISADPKKAAALPDKSTPQPGSNEPDRDEVLFMMGQFLAAEAKIKEAREGRKRLRNQARLRGFNLEQFDLAIAERERDDGTTIDNLKAFKRYCEFLGLPTGFQLSFFDSPNGGGYSQQSVNEKAYHAGYELGVMAKATDDQAYPPMTPEGQSHLEGWHSGQAIHLEKFKRLNAAFEADAAAKASKGIARESEH